MQEIANILFKDLGSASDAVIIVRRSAAGIALCVSIASGGDVEVLMNREDAKVLAKALQVAIE